MLGGGSIVHFFESVFKKRKKDKQNLQKVSKYKPVSITQVNNRSIYMLKHNKMYCSVNAVNAIIRLKLHLFKKEI